MPLKVIPAQYISPSFLIRDFCAFDDAGQPYSPNDKKRRLRAVLPSRSSSYFN
jgi:hypothetical protein